MNAVKLKEIEEFQEKAFAKNSALRKEVTDKIYYLYDKGSFRENLKRDEIPSILESYFDELESSVMAVMVKDINENDKFGLFLDAVYATKSALVKSLT